MDLYGVLLKTFVFLASISLIQCVRRKRRLTAEEQLIMDLFRGYDTDARGVINSNSTVTVDIQFLLLRIQRLVRGDTIGGILRLMDERSQVLMTTGLVITEWNDERLVWDPLQYGGIKDVVVRANRIWTPELAVINGADDMIREFQKIRVLISHTGKVHWEPGGVFLTTCDIDITHFPFDTQSCPIEIGAWAYKSSRMNLTTSMPEVEMGEYKINGEWSMLGTDAAWREVILPCCQDIRYSKVVFTLRMSRRYMFYIMNILVPCMLLSVLILIVFCVPPGAGEKISAGISVLLAFTVFLLMLADNVPRTSLDVPILVIYLGSTMALGTASVCLTVVVLNLHHRGSHTPVPKWARTIFLYHCARVFGLTPVPRNANDRRRVASRPNNYSKCETEGEAAEMVEIQHILNENRAAATPANAASCGIHGVTDNMLLAEAMQYHKVEIPFHKIDSGSAAATAGTSSSSTSKASREEVVRQRLEEVTKEWQLFARVLDRIFFCLVFLTMLCCALFILLSPFYKPTSNRFHSL